MVRIRGFTLVELLVVVSIIGILASVVTVNANSARRQSRDAKRKADIQNIAGALELYRATNRMYPNPSPAAGAVSSYSSQVGSPFRNALSTYTSDIPSDPGAYSYTYTPGTNGARFVLDARLESTSETAAFPCPTSQSDQVFFTTGICGVSGGPFHYRVAGP